MFLNKLPSTVVLLAVFGFGAHAFAQQPAKPNVDEKTVGDFYRGKTVRIIIGSGAGGTYDIYSRLLAKHMPRYLAGNPTVVVQPRAGAGGLIAANAVYNSEPKDGTVIGSFGETFVLRQAIGAPGIQFDSAKYQWLGAAINAPLACVARTDSTVSRRSLSTETSLASERAIASTFSMAGSEKFCGRSPLAVRGMRTGPGLRERFAAMGSSAPADDYRIGIFVGVRQL